MPIEKEDKPKFMPWNDDDFWSSPKVRKMNYLQRHFYRTLLQTMFYCDTRPYLPATDEELWTLADADSIEQWLANKMSVLAMFKPMEQCGGNVRLLGNDRVLKDWNRLMDKRETMAELGRTGGQARGRRTLSIEPKRTLSDGQASEVEVKGSEDKLREETLHSLAKAENVPARVGELAAEILHHTKRLAPEEKKELTMLGRAFPGQVVDDFREWAEFEGEGKAYPVAYYLRVATERLRGSGASAARDEREGVAVQPLMIEVAKLSDQTPYGKTRVAAAKLLRTYSHEEIILAFREHVSNLDDFGMKRAIQNFFEGGGGETIILLRRERADSDQRTRDLMARQERQMQEEQAREQEQVAEDDRRAQDDIDSLLQDEQEPLPVTAVAPNALGVAPEPNWDELPL